MCIGLRQEDAFLWIILNAWSVPNIKAYSSNGYNLIVKNLNFSYHVCFHHTFGIPRMSWHAKTPQEFNVIRGSWAFTSFHEFARGNNLGGVLNASLLKSSLSERELLTWLSRVFMNSSTERLFHLVDTYKSLSEMPGISFKKWSYNEARLKTFCDHAYARKFVKARELQFLGGMLSTDMCWKKSFYRLEKCIICLQ